MSLTSGRDFGKTDDIILRARAVCPNSVVVTRQTPSGRHAAWAGKKVEHGTAALASQDPEQSPRLYVRVTHRWYRIVPASVSIEVQALRPARGEEVRDGKD